MVTVESLSGGDQSCSATAPGRRAFTTLYAVIILTLLAGFVSLGVDWGHVQLVKTQLQVAADSAARAAAAQLPNGISATQTAAVTWGGYNTADGSTVVIDPTNDVEFGTWDPVGHTFTVLTGANRSTANSLRITARRTAARGNATALTFGALVGRSTCDTTVQVIAYAKPGVGNYGLVGMSSVLLQNNTITTDSYDASAGSYNSGTARQEAFLATNGSVTLNGTVTVKKDLYMQAGQSLSANGTVTYGTRQVLSSPLVFPTPSAGSYATTNSNGNLGLPASGANASFSSGSFAVPAGTYYLNSFNMSGGTLTCSGPVTVYMNGNFSISGGSITPYNNLPTNFTIKMVASAGVNLSGITSFYGDVVAPSSPINISGVTSVYGRLIGSQLSVSGSCALHVDSSLPAIFGASTAPNAATTFQTVK